MTTPTIEQYARLHSAFNRLSGLAVEVFGAIDIDPDLVLTGRDKVTGEVTEFTVEDVLTEATEALREANAILSFVIPE